MFQLEEYYNIDNSNIQTYLSDVMIEYLIKVQRKIHELYNNDYFTLDYISGLNLITIDVYFKKPISDDYYLFQIYLLDKEKEFIDKYIKLDNVQIKFLIED